MFDGFSIVQLNKFIMSRLPGVVLCSTDRGIKRKKLRIYDLFQKLKKYGLNNPQQEPRLESGRGVKSGRRAQRAHTGPKAAYTPFWNMLQVISHFQPYALRVSHFSDSKCTSDLASLQQACPRKDSPNKSPTGVCYLLCDLSQS